MVGDFYKVKLGQQYIETFALGQMNFAIIFASQSLKSVYFCPNIKGSTFFGYFKLIEPKCFPKISCKRRFSRLPM